MAVHQCAQFSANPMHLHKQAVMCIGQYLLLTHDRGRTYTPDPTKGIEVYIDANFAGGRDPGDAINADNVYSRTGYVIQYAACPIYWQSKLKQRLRYLQLKQSTLHYIRL
jgi:hypothetical protein